MEGCLQITFIWEQEMTFYGSVSIESFLINSSVC